MNWLVESLAGAGVLCLIAAVTLWNPLVGLGFTGLMLLVVSFLVAYLGGPADGDDATG